MSARSALAIAGVVVAGCTSAPSSGGAVVSGEDASVLADVVTIEDVSTCAATEQCGAIGSGGVSFDTTTACGPCDSCLASACCDVATSCFAPADSGSESACANLADCEMACTTSDAGGGDDASTEGGDDGGTDCSASCESAFDSATIAAFNAFSSCYSTSCASACP